MLVVVLSESEELVLTLSISNDDSPNKVSADVAATIGRAEYSIVQPDSTDTVSMVMCLAFWNRN